MRNPMTVRRLVVAVVVADPVAAMIMVVDRVATLPPQSGPMLLRLPQRLWWRSPLFKKPLLLLLSASQWHQSLNLNRRCRLAAPAAAVRRPPDQRRPTRARSRWIHDERGGLCWTSPSVASERLILTRSRLPARTFRGSSSTISVGGVRSGVASGTSSASRMGISVGSGVGSGEGSGVGSGLGAGVGSVGG